MCFTPCLATEPRAGSRSSTADFERRPGILKQFRLRYVLLLTGLANFAATASAEQPKVWAVFAPHATLTLKGSAAPPCDGDYCALNALQDIWKRDALKQDRPPDVNANSVILDRARFQKEADRFGAADDTAALNYNILGSGICIGAFKGGAVGIRTC